MSATVMFLRSRGRGWGVDPAESGGPRAGKWQPTKAPAFPIYPSLVYLSALLSLNCNEGT
jgi:hypothetical protein